MNKKLLLAILIGTVGAGAYLMNDEPETLKVEPGKGGLSKKIAEKYARKKSKKSKRGDRPTRVGQKKKKAKSSRPMDRTDPRWLKSYDEKQRKKAALRKNTKKSKSGEAFKKRVNKLSDKYAKRDSTFPRKKNRDAKKPATSSRGSSGSSYTPPAPSLASLDSYDYDYGFSNYRSSGSRSKSDSKDPDKAGEAGKGESRFGAKSYTTYGTGGGRSRGLSLFRSNNNGASSDSESSDSSDSGSGGVGGGGNKRVQNSGNYDPNRQVRENNRAQEQSQEMQNIAEARFREEMELAAAEKAEEDGEVLAEAEIRSRLREAEDEADISLREAARIGAEPGLDYMDSNQYAAATTESIDGGVEVMAEWLIRNPNDRLFDGTSYNSDNPDHRRDVARKAGIRFEDLKPGTKNHEFLSFILKRNAGESALDMMSDPDEEGLDVEESGEADLESTPDPQPQS